MPDDRQATAGDITALRAELGANRDANSTEFKEIRKAVKEIADQVAALALAQATANGSAALAIANLRTEFSSMISETKMAIKNAEGVAAAAIGKESNESAVTSFQAKAIWGILIALITAMVVGMATFVVKMMGVSK